MHPSTTNNDLTQIADACLDFLVSDVEELSRFMVIVGYDPESLREASGSEALSLGLIDYFASNEKLLVAVCAKAEITPERFMRTWAKANQHE